MKYFFISDVHGEYDKMLTALAAAKFEVWRDTLVTLGDLFDRGSKSKEVLQFVMKCPHHICIMGNHDSRLRDILLGAHPNYCDNANGVRETLKSFCNLNKLPTVWWGKELLKSDSTLQSFYRLLWHYLDECVYAIEFADLIGTHGWLPVVQKDGKLITDLRGGLTAAAWEQAMWANTETMIANQVFPNKTLIIGHWHSYRLATIFGNEKRINNGVINTSTYIHQQDDHKVICIDGATNLDSGQVNVFIYESSEQPKIYVK